MIVAKKKKKKKSNTNTNIFQKLVATVPETTTKFSHFLAWVVFPLPPNTRQLN